MSKVVTLDLNGHLKQGFHVSLEIKEEGYSTIICGRLGNLPPAPELHQGCESHWKIYRSLAASYRIKNKQIITQTYVQSCLEQCHQSSIELKKSLNQWVKSEGFREIHDCIKEQLSPTEPARFLMRGHDECLQKLPWYEWDMFKSYPYAELGWSYGNYQATKCINTNPGKVKVLVILGSPQGIDIDIDKNILQGLPDVDVCCLYQPQRREINDQLWEYQWDIIFFAGHSRTESQVGKIDINPDDSMTIDDLCKGLRKAIDRGLKLAIFNSCDGLGLAKSLFQLQIPQIIVMRELIPDAVAHKFVEYFLQNLAGGNSLYLSLRDAREKLQGLEDKFPCATWLPMMFQNPGIVPLTWEDLRGEKTPTRKLHRVNFIQLLLASFVCTGLVMGVRSLGWLQDRELKTYDQMMSMGREEKADNRIVIVKVTDEDMNNFPGLFNTSKITDELLLKALQKINQHQPATIGLDILRDIPTYSVNQVDIYPQLTSYLRENSHIFPICKVGEHIITTSDDYGYSPPQNSRKNNLSFNDFVVDGDRVLRRHLIYMDPPERSVCQARHALSLQLARNFLSKSAGIKLEVIQTPTGKLFKLGQVILPELKNKVGFYQTIDDGGYQILLNYRSTKNIATEISLHRVINNDFPADFFQNKIVLVGYISRAKGNDFYATPVSNKPGEEMAGVQIHAHMTSQLISIALGERKLLTFLPWWGDAAAILLITFIGGIPILYGGKSLSVIIMLGEIIIITGIGYYVYITGPLIPTIIALVFITIYAYVSPITRINHVKENK
ncbi:CHASE2 domain-containing protein [Anabaenopsis arnoldii]|uniref:CHASE2 domain-containing protein n=1 Tax=Anabaenopsis arnoldii TaxID=2152938 RepID=A0ABT5ARP5_9CYAN|nr:CHASE2 domain-containing protein [Anabaenopsis arnoldii]MDB9539106.1 CHASE2 domain-containing protein [Anabaenopsis arnoldii]MDH6091394.1 CHASE2 domain-containing protein [Anabaenopsis arnoldii]